MTLDKFGRRHKVAKESKKYIINKIKQIEKDIVGSNTNKTELWLQLSILQETVTRIHSIDLNNVNVNFGLLQTQVLLLNDRLAELEKKHVHDMKRFAEQLFYWINKVHFSKKPFESINSTNFVDWNEIFKDRIQ